MNEIFLSIKHSLPLFHKKCNVIVDKAKMKEMTIKERVKLFSALYMSCQSRQANLGDFFCHENHDFPSALSDYGEIRSPTNKADFLECLPKFLNEEPIEILYDSPNVDAYVIDGPALVQATKPKYSKTYGKYCNNEIKNKIQGKVLSSEQTDLIFDVYKKDTRKRHTRLGRGKKGCVCIIIAKDTPVYKKKSKVD